MDYILIRYLIVGIAEQSTNRKRRGNKIPNRRSCSDYSQQFLWPLVQITAAQNVTQEYLLRQS